MSGAWFDVYEKTVCLYGKYFYKGRLFFIFTLIIFSEHNYFLRKSQITPVWTAFHDTQRLLLEACISNVCYVLVLFAPLMKK